jgi:catechol 1,2-dioxygenase
MATTASQERLLADVIATYKDCPNPRLREIIESLLRHLHAFVAETRLTRDEWMAGIEYLTAVGHKATPERQEFILLSDAIGVSSLVEMINYAGAPGSTENTVLGPFHFDGSPERENGASILENESAGTPLHVAGTVRALDGRPIAGATIDVWQNAAHGLYPVQDPGQDPMNMRGIFKSDADGRYSFITTRPIDYPIPTDGPVGEMLAITKRHPMRAAHVHLIVSAPGYHSVTTHIFDSESQYLKSDVVFGVRDSLIVKFEPRGDGSLSATFDVVLTPVG